MLKICFVCLGNICRSPMAEFLMKYKLEKLNKSAKVDSKATSYEEVGNPVYPHIRPYLDKIGADYKNKRAERLQYGDGDYYDYIIVMEARNLTAVKSIVDSKNYGKIFRLCDFTSSPHDVADPWYTRDFDKCYKEIDFALDEFIDFLVKNKLI